MLSRDLFDQNWPESREGQAERAIENIEILGRLLSYELSKLCPDCRRRVAAALPGIERAAAELREEALGNAPQCALHITLQ